MIDDIEIFELSDDLKEYFSILFGGDFIGFAKQGNDVLITIETDEKVLIFKIKTDKLLKELKI